jgi:hypothetical protein
MSDAFLVIVGHRGDRRGVSHAIQLATAAPAAAELAEGRLLSDLMRSRRIIDMQIRYEFLEVCTGCEL